MNYTVLDQAVHLLSYPLCLGIITAGATLIAEQIARHDLKLDYDKRAISIGCLVISFGNFLGFIFGGATVLLFDLLLPLAFILTWPRRKEGALGREHKGVKWWQLRSWWS